MPKNTLLQLLAHEKTRDLMGRIARGDDPRHAVAQLAGVSLAEGLAKVMGVRQFPQAPADHPKRSEPDVTDAEFTVINVTDQARKAKGKK